ncbi:RNA-binding cell elongation regulator Jag/EloR [Rubrobacter aplysinae]|uniref:RNA-binding cell elongation regulator Jag/EloR n=1 Tax=Rubrobacter aplysinae TaxID=909625 RepID=UPI00069E2A15|nr:RNA-binding cell elongation regulator Jag/EloR [Rubrobacter aplysinae]
MSERREFNASTVEQAIEKAASTLDLKQQEITYEILDEGSSGFLGLGVRDARIAVEVPLENVQEHPDPEIAPEQDPAPLPEPSETLQEAEEGSGMAEVEDDAPDTPESSSPELLAEVHEQVESTLDAMAFDSEIEVRDEGEIVAVNIDSEDAGLLIGQKGETLDSLEHLVNAALRRGHEHPKKVVLDCEGYRERRVKAVQGMAHRTAKRVVKENKSADLPPMRSSERRAVHAYLKDDQRVETSSSGNDESRRVTISPAQG